MNSLASFVKRQKAAKKRNITESNLRQLIFLVSIGADNFSQLEHQTVLWTKALQVLVRHYMLITLMRTVAGVETRVY